MAGKHSYFAYGSNLCVRQMAQRCPDASDPRRATLSDHDWLINDRGVATVERFAGAEVHGVIWQLSDHDLATLDSAEGVPVRYRRDELTVHTDTSTTALRPALRDQAIWSGSSTAPATTACPTAGSSSSSGGIPPAGRSALRRQKMLHQRPFQSFCAIPRSSSTACCARRSASWPSTVAVWSR